MEADGQTDHVGQAVHAGTDWTKGEGARLARERKGFSKGIRFGADEGVGTLSGGRLVIASEVRGGLRIFGGRLQGVSPMERKGQGSD